MSLFLSFVLIHLYTLYLTRIILFCMLFVYFPFSLCRKLLVILPFFSCPHRISIAAPFVSLVRPVRTELLVRMIWIFLGRSASPEHNAAAAYWSVFFPSFSSCPASHTLPLSLTPWRLLFHKCTASYCFPFPFGVLLASAVMRAMGGCKIHETTSRRFPRAEYM